MSTRSINILIGSGVQEADKDLFFGPILPDDEWFTLPDSVQFPQVLATIGIFKSTSEARNNGWNKPVPNGFTFPFKIGKLHHEITILKII